MAANPRVVVPVPTWQQVCPLRPAPGPSPMSTRERSNPGQAAMRSLASPYGAKGQRRIPSPSGGEPMATAVAYVVATMVARCQYCQVAWMFGAVDVRWYPQMQETFRGVPGG